ncbi:ABC transporter substrate-binding protein [Noviherbaspirillum pedocola]|uniref:ABC transporter substrate-binding protein n=1 Tax=Noviherbaspirillum pedocola TaxID=2801341 RepID=A0A934W4R0_9BURK|nr:ABC transporter substrate-binding protein [Noviherbaspirillum pedocola]MBK4733090.1 ABC transporter substrate-binding protein [Noviherbaspirillum pedocola]
MLHRFSSVLPTASLLLSAALAFPSHAETGVTAHRILLGESAAFSGPAAQLGIDLHAGAKLYFDSVNQQGGIHGRKIEIITADDKYEPELAAQNTRRLIQDEGVFALFGYVGTPTSNAALPVVTAAHVPFFAPFSGAQSLRQPFRREIFHIRASYAEETEHLVDRLVQVGIRNIAVFHQNDAYGQDGLLGVQQALKKRGIALVEDATVERNSANVSVAAQRLLAKRPDAIIQISTYATSAALIKTMRSAGYTGQFHNVSFVGAQPLARALGEDGPGVGVSEVMPFPWKTANPTVTEYVKELKRANAGEPNFSSLEGFVAAKIFVEGLRRAGPDLTRDKLITALESINLRNYDIGFPVEFSARDHRGSRFVDMTIITRDGKFLN